MNNLEIVLCHLSKRRDAIFVAVLLLACVFELETAAAPNACTSDVEGIKTFLRDSFAQTNTPPYSTNVFMVRAIKLQTSGNGSYTNLSQGAMRAP